MGKGYRHGSEESSYGLQIVGGTTRPKNPTQGMVWANTPNEITSVYLADVKPSNPVTGMLWVKIGYSGNSKIVSPVSKEWITVYPLSAEQYISGAWASIETYSYQDGEWVEWWNGELYDAGNKFEAVTGGWDFTNGRGTTSYTNGDYTDNGDSITLTVTASKHSIQAVTAKKIDLTGWNTLNINVLSENVGYLWLKVGETQGMSNGVAKTDTISAGESQLDISGLDGEYYVAIEAFSNKESSSAGSATFNKIWLSK